MFYKRKKWCCFDEVVWGAVTSTFLLFAASGINGGNSSSKDHPDGQVISGLPHVIQEELGGILEKSCALLCLPPCKSETLFLLHHLSQIFEEDPHIFVGQFDEAETYNNTIHWKSQSANIDTSTLVFYGLHLKDRSCLLSPPKTKFEAEAYQGPMVLSLVVQFLNEKCEARRTVDGSLNAAGMFHSYIMSNLYHPEDMVQDCPRVVVRLLDQPTFFQQYLFRSRPVVIEGGARDWPAMTKWTHEYLREVYGAKRIHIKLTKDGNFEGVESANLWNGYKEDWIPQAVRSQLDYPELVVVRPATAEMLFSEFLDFIVSGNRTHSAYLEYSSIPLHLPLLENDIQEMPFLNHLLERRHLNIWLSDGDTIGKLHFDPFDNFLCQVSGEKLLTLFDPHHNENLYEGHIPEARLNFDASNSSFSRHTLLKSTSMVMSPVDIVDPDLNKFPRFRAAKRLHCKLRPGDVLFMPAFWWHEVQSYPDTKERRNLAVNFWYESVLTKEFPCPECRPKFNYFYRHFLEEPPV